MIQRNRLLSRIGKSGIFLLLLVVCGLSCTVLATDSAAEDQIQYVYLSYGDVSNDVLELQTRLMELEYFQDGLQFTPTVYDEGTQAAVESFCSYNGVLYSGTGVSPSLQSLIFAEGAIPYSAPEKKLTASQKLSAYMLREVPVFGASVPMFVMWICAGILIILILFLLVYFFVPEKKRPEPRTDVHEVTQYWRKPAVPDGIYTDVTQRKAHGATIQKIEIQVQYEGEKRMEVCSCPPAITIGRKDCTILLDRSDKTVSASHCEIYLRGAMWMLRDHSTNGLRLNGKRIHRTECRINPGDRITIGSHELTIQ